MSAIINAERSAASHAEFNPLRRQQGHATSLRRAIDAKCAECMGCTLRRIEPGFRNDIRDCGSTTCPLHRVRPYQAKRS